MAAAKSSGANEPLPEVVASGMSGERTIQPLTDEALGPRTYSLALEGDYLEPHFSDGDFAVCDPDVPARAGDMVAIYCHDRSTPMLARLLLAPPPRDVWDDGLIVGQIFNPPRRLSVLSARVQAVHKVACKGELCHG